VALVSALRLAQVRTFAAARVNQALSGLFLGKLRIEHIARINLSGASGVDATVFDAGGHAVIVARGASAQLAVVPLLWSVLVHPHDSIVIDIRHVTVVHAEVQLIDDGLGLPTLADAFFPRHPNPGPSTAPLPTLHIRPIDVEHAWVHGQLGSAPAIDADIVQAKAALDLVSPMLHLQINGTQLRTRGLPYQVDPEGTAGGTLEIPIIADSSVEAGHRRGSPVRTLAAHAFYQGRLAGSAISAAFDWTDDKMTASLDAPSIEPASIARYVPRTRLRQPLVLHAMAEGALADIHFEARASVARASTGTSTSPSNGASLVVVGHAALDKDAQIEATLRAEHVDLEALLAGAPESRLGGNANVHLEHTRGAAWTGRYAGSSSEAVIAGTELPAINLDGNLHQEHSGSLSTNGQARILEPGAQTTINYSVMLGTAPTESVVSIESSTEVADPARLRSLANGLRARGSLEVSAHYWPDSGHWTAQSQARLHNVGQAQFGAGLLDIRAEAAAGPMAPSGTAHVHGSELRAAGQIFHRLDLVLDGTLRHARLAATLTRDDAQQLKLTTELAMEPTLRAHATHLVLPSSEGNVEVSFGDIRSSGGTTHIDALHIEGAGTLDTSLSFGREIEQLELSTDSLDWARLVRLFGLALPVRSGHATLVAHYVNKGPAAGGFIRGRVAHVQLEPFKDASADVDLTLAHNQLNGTIAAQLAPRNSVSVSMQAVPLGIVEHPEQALASRDFSLSLRAALDLAKLQPLITAHNVPLGHAAGTIDFAMTASGPCASRTYPEISAQVGTHSLELAGLRAEQAPIKNTTVAERAQPWSLRNVDGKLDFSISGVSPRAEASARVFDQQGTLVEVEAAAELPASAWRTLRVSAVEALRMPLVAKFHMPKRSVGKLPALFWAQSLRGKASLDGTLEGTLENPTVVVDGAIEHLSAWTERIAGKKSPALDVSVHAAGSRSDGNIQTEAKAEGRTVGKLQASWRGDITRLATASLDAPSPLQGDLVVRLDHFPLEALPTFRSRQLSGLVTGDLALHDWGHNASLVGTLYTEQLGFGRIVVEHVKVGVNGSDGQLLAKAQISGHNSGVAEADITTKMRWGDSPTPTVDPGVRGSLHAKGLQLGILSTFLSGSVNEIEGSLDAKLEATLDNGVPRIEGQATLSQGVIQIPSIGQRFDSIGAVATIHQGALRVDQLNARGITGRVTGSAQARIDGLSLTSGQAHFRIEKGEQIPITVEGQAVGDAWGRADVTLARSAVTNTTNIRVDLPEILVDLPDLDPTSLQQLEPDEHVRIGAHQSEGQFVSLPVQPLVSEKSGPGEALLVEVHLGNSVWIQKGKAIKVQLGGDLLARIANQTTLEGRLELKGGKLDVSGKMFEIERGVVTFDGGDPGNPSINATARWDSPTEYRVYADYTGTAKDGRLKLRSEPPLSADKVISLLLFGTPEGSFGSSGTQGGGTGESTSAAISVAGDTAVTGLNRAISGVTQLDVSARLDTSTGTARPELDVQLSPRLTARMTRAIGEPAVGQSPDRTFLTFELRLLRAWALSAVVGDHGGSALDLLWRKRY
jgi:translocation and assembly module TamB